MKIDGQAANVKYIFNNQNNAQSVISLKIVTILIILLRLSAL